MKNRILSLMIVLGAVLGMTMAPIAKAQDEAFSAGTTGLITQAVTAGTLVESSDKVYTLSITATPGFLTAITQEGDNLYSTNYTVNGFINAWNNIASTDMIGTMPESIQTVGALILPVRVQIPVEKYVAYLDGTLSAPAYDATTDTITYTLTVDNSYRTDNGKKAKIDDIATFSEASVIFQLDADQLNALALSFANTGGRTSTATSSCTTRCP